MGNGAYGVKFMNNPNQQQNQGGRDDESERQNERPGQGGQQQGDAKPGQKPGQQNQQPGQGGQQGDTNC
jgi:hypothetical protein